MPPEAIVAKAIHFVLSEFQPKPTPLKLEDVLKAIMYSVLNITDDITHCGNIGHVVNDFRKVLELAHQNDFTGVNVDLTPGASGSEINELLDKYSLKPVSFGFPIRLFDTEQAFKKSLDDFENQAGMASELGCHLTLCYIPPYSDELNFNDLFIRTSKRLNELKPLLEKYPIKIGFEFIGPTETRRKSKYDFIHTIDSVRALIAASELYGYGEFKLDVHHWQNSGAGVLDLHHLDPEYLLYVELNDGLKGYDIFTMPESERELPFETGITHIKDFLRALRRKGYQAGQPNESIFILTNLANGGVSGVQ
uniref:Sugar phosphate isomerase/epimerase n=1 Tax=Candidatus Kentrum eta TaxID=2126337 RepID=A0A450VJV1_9GAMM|nr:MAG: Sugar phosphate isomerase/epimerase [Candidatus Kentron sp. H]VFK05373.1 MAG: Sugar phosphate isomerase/epimerase [Candidatus Kentron sp. H]VFK08412.1 MAG: Sugar phosphate isomerase/epimerase [Candidatus Kentron sp. H]